MFNENKKIEEEKNIEELKNKLNRKKREIINLREQIDKIQDDINKQQTLVNL